MGTISVSIHGRDYCSKQIDDNNSCSATGRRLDSRYNHDVELKDTLVAACLEVLTVSVI